MGCIGFHGSELDDMGCEHYGIMLAANSYESTQLKHIKLYQATVVKNLRRNGDPSLEPDSESTSSTPNVSRNSNLQEFNFTT